MGSHPFLSINHICFSVKLPGRPSRSSRGAMLSQQPDLGSADSALWLMGTEHSGCDRQIWGSQEGSGDSELAGPFEAELCAPNARVCPEENGVGAVPAPSHRPCHWCWSLQASFQPVPRACLAPPFPFVPRKLSSHECTCHLCCRPPCVSSYCFCELVTVF